jgi:hypothetical protein
MKYFIIILLSINALIIRAQSITLNSLGSITNILNESSGIVYINPNRLYTHNDSGGNNDIFEMDNSGNLVRTITVSNASNIDWEDITKDLDNNLYIGDFGNNNNDRTDLKIYKIPSPQTFSGNSTTAEVIEFHYPDQTMFPPNPTKRNFDAEGMIWYNDSLYIFTKNRTAPFNGYCKMYKIPAIPGNYTAQICDSVFLCSDSQADCWVTGASISPDNSHVALLNHSKIWWFSCFNGSNFFKGSKATITLNTNTQKEGIAFKNNHDIFVTDELSTIDNSGGKLYEADMINFNQEPYVNIIQDTIICDNCTFTVDSAAGSLVWSNGTFGPTVTPNYTGWYVVNATSINNCFMLDSIYVSYLQGLQQGSFESFSVNILQANHHQISGQIKHKGYEVFHIQLADITGKIIAQTQVSGNDNNIAFTVDTQLSDGYYLLQFSSAQNQKTLKIAIINECK